MVARSTVIVVGLTSFTPILRYGILDALVTYIGGLSFDILACQYQETFDKVTACQQDDSNKSGSLDSNLFSLAATLASISDVLCMPRCALCD